MPSSQGTLLRRPRHFLKQNPQLVLGRQCPFLPYNEKTSSGFSYTVSLYLELPGLRTLPRAWPSLPLAPKLSKASLQVGVCSNILQEPGIAS